MTLHTLHTYNDWITNQADFVKDINLLDRELYEALGAKVNAKDVVILGAVTEPKTRHCARFLAYP